MIFFCLYEIFCIGLCHLNQIKPMTHKIPPSEAIFFIAILFFFIFQLLRIV